jgi:non-canonical purine NTP pyrophosphatase (RdgB/HAM1 family)
MSHLVFVTGSTSKLDEAKRILRRPLGSIDIDLPEIQSLDLREVAEAKAREAFRQLGEPVMVEDTALVLLAWQVPSEREDLPPIGLPGPLIKWFLKPHIAGLHRLCRMLDPFPDRAAEAQTLIVTFDGEPTFYLGRTRGRIAPAPVGSDGFGWDPIFIPDGSEQSFAQMSPAEKDTFSMRRKALEAMASDGAG